MISDIIIQLHDLARNTQDLDIALKIRLLADQLAKIGNELHEKNNTYDYGNLDGRNH